VKNLKKISLLLLVFILVTGFLNQPLWWKVSATSLEDQVKQQNEKLERLKLNQQQIIAKEKEQSYKIAGLSDEISAIERKLTEKGRALQLVEQELNVANAEYMLVTNQIDRLSQSIMDKEKKMDKILYILYKNYTLNYTAYLFSSKSINEILDKTLYLQYLFQANKSYFTNLNTERDKIKEIKLNTVALSVKAEKKSSDMKKSIAEYSSLEKQKGQLLINEAVTRQLNKQKLYENEQEMKQTEAFIKNLLRKIAEIKAEEARRKKLGSAPWGKIVWPLIGKVSSGYGMRIHPIFGGYRMHTGIDIDASSGTPIHACAKGVVVFAGWLSGYGNVVIIQHDLTHSSLYAHQRSYFVKLDQEVSLGEVIGEVGTTGWSTDPHLHFEIRVNGEYDNPLNYLPK
jgi:murein DD-endopeptidase MepM/ murein hydrolase activator NlpD